MAPHSISRPQREQRAPSSWPQFEQTVHSVKSTAHRESSPVAARTDDEVCGDGETPSDENHDEGHLVVSHAASRTSKSLTSINPAR